MGAAMWFVLAASLIPVAAPPEEAPTSREKLVEHLRTMVRDSRAPAEKALKQLRGLATKENFGSLGFDSLEEVPTAELGQAMPLVIVRLDELRTYEEKGEAYKLLHPLPKVLYGVTVRGEPRCGLEVQERDGKWETSALGIAGPARQFVMAVKKQTEKDRASSLFLVKVLALNETYLGYQTEQGVKLIHVRAQAEAKQSVEARPASAVLAELVKAAKDHDGSPR
jgi:hypothetical protein